MSANVERMYSGEKLVPWWVGMEAGEAVVLDGMLTATEARAPAGLLWEPELLDLYTEAGLVDGWKAIARNDTRAHLGVVTDRYSTISNGTIARVADEMCGGRPCCTTAGVLRTGAVVWFCMKMGEFQVRGDDSPVVLYSVVTTGHDGCHRLKLLITPVRVVCNNTLRAAKMAAEYEVSVCHQGNVEGKFEEAAAAAREVLTFGEKFKALGDLLAATAYAEEFGPALAMVLTATKAERTWLAEQQRGKNRTPPAWVPAPGAPLVDQLLAAAPRVPEDLIPAAVRDERAAIERLLTGAGAAGVEGTRLEGTAWGAFMGVTQHLDHATDVGGDRRAESILWGRAAKAKDLALDAILAQTNLVEAAERIMAHAA